MCIYIYIITCRINRLVVPINILQLLHIRSINMYLFRVKLRVEAVYSYILNSLFQFPLLPSCCLYRNVRHSFNVFFVCEFERRTQYSMFGNFDINQVPLRLTVKQTFIPSESKDFDRMTYRKRELQNGKQNGC